MFVTDVTGFMSPYNHQNVELLDPWEQNNIVSSYMDQLRPPERPELAVEEVNEWRPLHHPQQVWCQQQGPASADNKDPKTYC